MILILDKLINTFKSEKDMKKNSEKKIQNTKPYRHQNEILIFDYRIRKDF